MNHQVQPNILSCLRDHKVDGTPVDVVLKDGSMVTGRVVDIDSVVSSVYLLELGQQFARPVAFDAIEKAA